MNISTNRFFKIALDRAARLAGKPGRIISLLAQLSLKISQTSKESLNMRVLREHFFVIGRMIKAHISGTYKMKSMRVFIMLLAAIIYFINPIDLIPDFVFGIGLADDLAVLTWVYKVAYDEVTLFRNWEDSQINSVTLS